MNVDIEIETAEWQQLPELHELAESALAVALGLDEKRSVSLLFTSDEEVRKVNQQWRGFDKPTNVLSFPAAPHPVPEGEVAHLGDLVLAWQTVKREAEEAGKPVQHHITHLVVHGALHLLGYDHETDEEANEMESKERVILASLGIADPYES